MRHIAAKCPEKSSNPTSSSSSKKKLCYAQKVTHHPISKTKVSQVLASCLVGSRPRNPITSVIIDSGATDHFFSNRDLFSTYTEYEHEFETGTGEKIAAHGYGNIDLRMNDLTGNVNTLTVTNVSWAPELGHNLLSTIPLARKGVEVCLRKAGQPSKIVVDEEVFGLADIIENQYVIRLAETPKPAIVNRVKAPTIETWHARMGHLGYRSLLELPKLAHRIEIKGPAPMEICGGCMKGRSQRKPSRTPMTRATEFLEEIHSDLGGPLPPTRWGEQYYISFYDDATGTYYVKTMQHKSQTFEKFLKFISWAENQSEKKLKRYWTDGGEEFDNEALKSWCLERGVQWEPSAPYTPEQNGKAERLNYTLMSSVRSIMASMKLPKSLWGEILRTVAYLKNRSPSQKGVTPYERANGEKPNLKHLRVIGSRAWVHVPEKMRKKLNDRAWQGIFVGYEGNSLYRIYHPLTGKIHKTRDVDIDEGLLYDKSEVNPWDFADTEWENSDDSFFADPLEFDNEEAETNTRSASIAPGRKSVELLESGTGRNDVRSGDQGETQPLDNNHNDTESALTLVPDSIDSPPR